MVAHHCAASLPGICAAEAFLSDDPGLAQAEGFDMYVDLALPAECDLPPRLRPRAWWILDAVRDPERTAAKAAHCDAVFAAQQQDARLLQREGVPSAEWLPFACAPTYHHQHPVERLHDVCFIGNVVPGERQRLLELLQSEFERVYVGRAYWDHMAREFSRSRVVFNRSARGDVNLRVFEAVACGSLLITDDVSTNGLQDLLRSGEHLVTYRDDRELLHWVRHYLEREGDREMTARRGCEEVHAKHTYAHRMRRIIEVACLKPSPAAVAALHAAPRVPDKGVLQVRSARRPTISLCMIARDEEANIANCLNSIRPWVDEMIVVDTGSCDRTPAIAQACGARVEHFRWCDDFSAARNESLRHATGDWVFWMDADDIIDETNGRRLRELAASAGAEVYGITLRVHCLPRPGEHAGVEMVDHVKLIRNHPEVRFQFHIHEQVLPSIRRLGKDVAYSDAHVVHAGYDATPEGQRKKRERDLRLLRLDLAEYPEHPFVHFNIGMTALHTGDPETATHHLRQSIELAGRGESHLRKAYALLTAAYRRLGQGDEARRVCEQGLEECPGDPELLFNRGLVCQEMGDVAAAEDSYLHILGTGAEEPYFRSVDTGIAGFKTRHNLATLYRDMGREDAAEAQLRHALTEEPGFLPSWLLLADLLHSGGRSQELDALVGGLKAEAATRGMGWLIEARLLSDASRLPEALAHIEAALAHGHGPWTLAAQKLQSDLLLRLGRLGDAVSVLREIVRQTPEATDSQGNLVLALLDLGCPPDALQACEEALSHLPDDPRLRALLTETQHRLHRGAGG
jgi:tetratricopeptide (TPR) repeat protein